MPSAVVLLSGGLDSATALAIAQNDGYEVHALSFRYGQRHSAELDAARAIAQAAGVREHIVAEIDLRAWGGSALTSDISVPKGRDESEMGEGIPVTYVPARNTVFLAFGLSFAEAIGARRIFCGVNALDYSGYPDCRPEYIDAFNALSKLATRNGVEGDPITVEAPLIHLTKAQIITTGTALGVDYSLTHSCYDPQGDLACGQCDSCILRAKGFAEVGVPDPTRYAAQPAVSA